jgi:hypothetical protein
MVPAQRSIHRRPESRLRLTANAWKLWSATEILRSYEILLNAFDRGSRPAGLALVLRSAPQDCMRGRGGNLWKKLGQRQQEISHAIDPIRSRGLGRLTGENTIDLPVVIRYVRAGRLAGPNNEREIAEPAIVSDPDVMNGTVKS